jgi:hypothetical protein
VEIVIYELGFLDFTELLGFYYAFFQPVQIILTLVDQQVGFPCFHILRVDAYHSIEYQLGVLKLIGVD